MDENYAFRMKDESLSHHGIEGQKWGVRNGPPYPLGSGQHSAAEKRAMKKEQKQTFKELQNNRMGLRSVLNGQLVSKKLEELRNNIPEVNEYISQYRSIIEYPFSKEGKKELEMLAKRDFEKYNGRIHGESLEAWIYDYQNQGDVYWDVLYENNENVRNSWAKLDTIMEKLKPEYEKAAKEILGPYSDRKVLGRPASDILVASMRMYFDGKAYDEAIK